VRQLAGSSVFPGKTEVLVKKFRKVKSKAEARRWLAAARASGRTLKEWARARGIDGRSLHAWQMNLERSRKPTGRSRSSSAMTRSTSGSTTQLVELVRAPTSSSPRYVVRIGSASIEFGDDVEAETLRRVVEVLRSC
jgi:hypothetical protein